MNEHDREKNRHHAESKRAPVNVYNNKQQQQQLAER